MIRPTALVVGIAAALVAGCGNDASEAPADAAASTSRTAALEAPAPSRAATSRRGKTIKVVRSQFGRILADGRGQAVYVFDKETSSRPECYGACAKAWPPVLTSGTPVAGKGVRGRRLGTTKRRGGKRQVTINGRPLYYYVHDAPGRVLCHDVEEFGGLWLVVRPDGTPVP
jgi:predicted lipoprotein with Yx(FWY)xxD motif